MQCNAINAMQCNAVQCNAMQAINTLQYTTMQCNAIIALETYAVVVAAACGDAWHAACYARQLHDLHKCI